MSYRLDPALSPAQAIRETACEQAERIVSLLSGSGGDTPHDVLKMRTRCKKIRAALKLGRPFLKEGEYRRRLHGWRDAGRLLAPLRDASAAHDSLIRLAPQIGPTVDGGDLTEVAIALNQTEATMFGGAGARSRIEAFRAVARREADALARMTWRERSSTTEPLLDGLSSSYQRARKAFLVAAGSSETTALHEARKHAKVHLHHLRLMRDVMQGRAAERIERLGALVRLLGDIQDIDVAKAALPGLARADDLGMARTARAAAVIEARLEAVQTRLTAEAKAGAEAAFQLRAKDYRRTLEPALASAEAG
ncbi:CHAD domain-containing protein [bacterium]|nr:CHAD domain-containing protein [bacterium]